MLENSEEYKQAVERLRKKLLEKD